MKKSCEEINQVLVDYADGKLSLDESNDVSAHLAECENCRKLLDALRKSLSLTGVIWEDSLSDIEKIHVKTRAKIKIHWLRYAAVAAGILIVVITSFVLRKSPEPVRDEPSFAEIERKINDSASAARLLAAAKLLAEYPDAKSIADRQYSYIIETYPKTPAAAEAKLKMQ